MTAEPQSNPLRGGRWALASLVVLVVVATTAFVVVRDGEPESDALGGARDVESADAIAVMPRTTVDNTPVDTPAPVTTISATSTTTTSSPATTMAPTTTVAPPDLLLAEMGSANDYVALVQRAVLFQGISLDGGGIDGSWGPSTQGGWETYEQQRPGNKIDGVLTESELAGVSEDASRYVPPTPWELECPGTLRQVVYNGSTVGEYQYGEMTARYPWGTEQSSPDLPIHLQGDPVPMGYHFCAAPGDFLYVSLQNPHDDGEITCTIEVDGILISNVRSTGGYVIASCKGTV